MYKLVVRRVGRMAKSLQLSLHELSSEEIRPLMPRLKDLVTSSTVHVNPKNQPAYDVRNQANIFATSNQMNPIHVEPQERRIVVFACNGSKKGDTAYFGRLLAHLNGAKRDAVARAFYQYLRDNVEVAPFLPFQEHRPRTAAYICCLRREREIGVCRSATSRNIPLFYKFLSAAIRQAAECHTERDTIKASTFHSQFHHWGRAGNYSTSTTTQSKFGGDLAALMRELEEKDPQQDTLTKRRHGAAQHYTVRWAELQTYLQETARYDSNAECGLQLCWTSTWR